MIPWLLGYHSVLVLLIPQWLLLSHLQSSLLISLKLKCWEWQRVPVLRPLLSLYSLLGDPTQFHSFKYNSYIPKILSPVQSFLQNCRHIYLSFNLTTDIFTWRSKRLLKYNIQNLTPNLFLQSVLIFYCSDQKSWFLCCSPHIQSGRKYYWLYLQIMSRIWPLSVTTITTKLEPL